MNKIRERRILASLLTAALLCGFPAFAREPEETLENRAAASPESLNETIDYSGRNSGFVRYLERAGTAAQPEQSIELKAEAAEISEDNAGRTEQQGKDCVLLQKGGWMEWRFSVDEQALYTLRITYIAGNGENGEQQNQNKEPRISLLLDGTLPYSELSEYALGRIYRDKTGIEQDEQGNDRIPEQETVQRWQTLSLPDTSGLAGRPLCLALEPGDHTLRLLCTEESLLTASLFLTGEEAVLTDGEALRAYQEQGVESISGVLLKYQAEAAFEKSNVTLYPQYDRVSPAVEPYHPVRVRRNIIGGGGWSENGMWISYKIADVPADGLYYLTLKYRQSYAIDRTTYRTIYINGKIPSEAFQNVAFPYGVDWARTTVSGTDGTPCPVYLKKGDNELRLEVSLGSCTDVLRMVDEAVFQLNQMYTKMVMVTGANPDPNRDYYLDKEIPDLIETFRMQAETLNTAADRFDERNGEATSESESIRTMARRLESLISQPRTIPKRLSSYREGLSDLSAWLSDMTEQPLALDYFLIHSADAELPSPTPTLGQKLRHFFETFFASFVEDYDSVGVRSGESIDVWVNMGRDQAQIVRSLITDSFTPAYGVEVNLSIVGMGFVEATLSGEGPDVALGISRGQPFNLASRNALLSFEEYEGLESMKSRFSETAMTPYQFEGKTYGIPCSQKFYMLFYRKDILAQMGLEVPETWDDIYRAVPKLQRSHMNIGLPYAVISAAAAVDNGLGAKDLFAALLLQNGGTFYTEDHTATRLDDEAAVNAFKSWCDFYTKYGFDLAYDFYTRFTTGEMPIGIASYEMFNTLSLGASEIRGLWGMAEIPGTPREDGSVDHSEAGAGTAAVIFKKTASPDACYHLVDWWTSDEVQDRFCVSVENLLGPGGRYETANLYAFSRQPWSDEQLQMLQRQRENVVELPEIPGSYYVSRSVDNAFRAVLYDGENPREIFARENRNINAEITRKRRELGLNIAAE